MKRGASSTSPEIPPRLARWTLRVLCPRSVLRVAQADLDDLYARARRADSLKQARRRYWKEVLILIWMLPLGSRLYFTRAYRAFSFAMAGMNTIKERAMNALQELAYAFRRLRRRPGFFVAAVVVLAVGIAAETVVFSMVDGVLFRPLPYRDSERLHMIVRSKEVDGRSGESSLAPGQALGLKHALQSFDRLAVYRGSSVFLETSEELIRLSGLRADADFLPLLGFRPVVGRGFIPDDKHAVLLGYDVWRRYFGSKESIVGQHVILSGTSYSVIGVLPKEFRLPAAGRPEVLITHDEELDPSQRRWGAFLLYGRLAPEATQVQSQEELNALAAAFAEEFPETDQGSTYRSVPIRDRVVDESDREILWTLQLLATLLLFVCCTNVAVLLLSKAAEEEREVALRLALGSGWKRIMGRFMSEAGLVAGGGVVVGGLMAAWILGTLPRLLPFRLPRMEEVAFDWRTALASGLIGFLVAVVCGAVPALGVIRTSPNACLKGTPMGFTRRDGALFRKGLMVAELAVAVVLTASAGLMMRTVGELRRVDRGFDAGNLLVVDLSLPSFKYGTGDHKMDPSTVFENLLAVSKALPGVRSAALALESPVNRMAMLYPWKREGIDRQGKIRIGPSSPGLLELLGVDLLQGRDLMDSDGSGDGVAGIVINQTFAREAFADESPLGRRVTLLRDDYVVVGVAADYQNAGLRDERYGQAFVHYRRVPQTWSTLLLKTGFEPDSLRGSVGEALRNASKDVQVYQISSMEERLIEALGGTTRALTVTTLFAAAMALILAAVGTFGVVFCFVRSRMREIGIRLVVGASGHRIISMVFRQSVAVSLLGIFAGLVLAAALKSYLASYLFQVAPTDPYALAGAILLLLSVTLLAHLWPLRCALRVDPVETLRHE